MPANDDIIEQISGEALVFAVLLLIAVTASFKLFFKADRASFWFIVLGILHAAALFTFAAAKGKDDDSRRLLWVGVAFVLAGIFETEVLFRALRRVVRRLLWQRNLIRTLRLCCSIGLLALAMFVQSGAAIGSILAAASVILWVLLEPPPLIAAETVWIELGKAEGPWLFYDLTITRRLTAPPPSSAIRLVLQGTKLEGGTGVKKVPLMARAPEPLDKIVIEIPFRQEIEAKDLKEKLREVSAKGEVDYVEGDEELQKPVATKSDCTAVEQVDPPDPRTLAVTIPPLSELQKPRKRFARLRDWIDSTPNIKIIAKGIPIPRWHGCLSFRTVCRMETFEVVVTHSIEINVMHVFPIGPASKCLADLNWRGACPAVSYMKGVPEGCGVVVVLDEPPPIHTSQPPPVDAGS